MTTKKPSRMDQELLEMAGAGIALGSWTTRPIGRSPSGSGPNAPPTAAPISGDEIRSVREKAHLGQAALAKYLNLTVGYVSQLERGTKEANGPALALLNVIRRKGHQGASVSDHG